METRWSPRTRGIARSRPRVAHPPTPSRPGRVEQPHPSERRTRRARFTSEPWTPTPARVSDERPLAVPNALPGVLRARRRAARQCRRGVSFHFSEVPPGNRRTGSSARRAAGHEERFASLEISRSGAATPVGTARRTRAMQCVSIAPRAIPANPARRAAGAAERRLAARSISRPSRGGAPVFATGGACASRFFGREIPISPVPTTFPAALWCPPG